MPRTGRMLTPLVAILFLLTACPSGDAGGSPGASVAPGETGGDGQIGGTVSLLGVWADEEEDSLLAMLEPFEQETGITVEYEATRDLSGILQTRVSGGNPPDVAGLPGTSDIRALAEQGALIDLSTVLDMDYINENYAEDWVNLGTVEGEYVGLMVFTALKGNIWYNPTVFEENGWEVPETFDDLDALVDEMADTGTAPWGIGLESAEASGWPATDWIEDFVLRQSGPDVYDQWYSGEIAWTSDEIRSAWEAFGRWATDERYVFGGPNTVLTTNFAEGGNCIFNDPAECYLHHQASFITGLGGFAEAEAGTDYDFFGFPDINDEFTGAVEGAGDQFGMFNDTPQARALMQYLATAEAQEIWIARGGKLSSNRAVSLDVYPDDISRKSAEILANAEIVRFDASDLMPSELNAAFWTGVLDYVRDPGSLDSILADLDQTAEDAFADQ